jgi:hypothetical protein
MYGVKKIEMKLENGVQQFSAQEVAHLLNQIRILDAIIKKEKGNK